MIGQHRREGCQKNAFRGIKRCWTTFPTVCSSDQRDYAGDSMSYFANGEKKFGYPPSCHGLFSRHGVLEYPSGRRPGAGAASGPPTNTTKPVRVSEPWGVITDIDKEKRRLGDLKKRAELRGALSERPVLGESSHLVGDELPS